MAQSAAAGGGYSSSADLSSPPNERENRPSLSPTPNGSDSTILVRGRPAENVDDAASGLAATSAATIGGPGTASNPAATAAKERKPRKRRDADADKKDKPARKPRTASAQGAGRRRVKGEASIGQGAAPSAIAPRRPQLPQVVESVDAAPAWNLGDPAGLAPTRPSENGFSMKSEAVRSPPPNYPPPMQPPIPTYPALPRTGGLAYDPVRSTAIPNPSQSSYRAPAPAEQGPPTSGFRPSASPSIASIIDPPQPSPQPSLSSLQTNRPAYPSPSQQTTSIPALSSSLSHVPGENPSKPPSMQNTSEQSSGMQQPTAVDADVDPHAPTSKTESAPQKSSSGPSSNAAPSPKPVRAKEAPPPLPQGSGLLSSAVFGVETAKDSNSAKGEEAPNIILHVDLKGKNNQIINFTRMAEQKYGFLAVHPRLAANSRRLAQVAAAGAALEKAALTRKLGGISADESGEDDTSVDIERESDNDGDVVMSGLNGETGTAANSETDGKTTKKRRRRKMEEYDQDDPFVDDSELAWEAQAVTSKDGFFVYCGPLIPEGDKPAIERGVEGPKRGRGRGRGGGPGSRGGRTAVTPAATAAVSEGGSGGRGGGPGSRGGTTTRKPRVTKAARLLMEKEKLEREKMAPLAAKPSGYPS